LETKGGKARAILLSRADRGCRTSQASRQIEQNSYRRPVGHLDGPARESADLVAAMERHIAASRRQDLEYDFVAAVAPACALRAP
jgi:hypothetical protein